jgi:hypothetical protein
MITRTGGNVIRRNSAMKCRLLISTLLSTALYVSVAAAEPEIAKYIGKAPSESFTEEQAAVDKLKAGIEAGDLSALAALLGLEPTQIGTSDGFEERFKELQEAAKERVSVEKVGDEKRVLLLGDLIWPFPFPLVKADDGKWYFDTEAGLEEILDRRIGENEIEAIDTVENYIVAQVLYHLEDWDEDGVREYAQTLKSAPDKRDGLYWPDETGENPSPLGPFIVEAKAEAAADSVDGYYGYRYRVLTKQGEDVAGGAYDYVINGNMIAGFALIAVPARYDETGIKTFLVSHNGMVYEKDLGPQTAEEAAKIVEFNPDKSWDIVE